jgi:CheY-like chemotaxis protein
MIRARWTPAESGANLPRGRSVAGTPSWRRVLSRQDQDFAFLAHDLSQVLWAIQGRARALALELSPSAAREVSIIAEDAAAAAAMLAGRSGSSADLQVVVADAWRQTLDRARALSIQAETCRLRGPDASVRVAVPEHAMRRILGNLFANAVAAGCAVVTVASRVRPSSGLVEIVVSDDGPGIAPSLRSELFSRERTIDTPEGGGLGLPGARNLAGRWGGDLMIGESDIGACFVLTVPGVLDSHRANESVDREAVDARSIEEIPVDEPDGLRVLVVDDDHSVREMLENLLSVLGHRPSLTGDFEEALALNAAARFDVALIDLRLPGKSGIELAERLRTQDRSLAVVLLTGWGQEHALTDAPGDCVDLTGVKPLDLPQLRRLLASAARLTEARRKI